MYITYFKFKLRSLNILIAHKISLSIFPILNRISQVRRYQPMISKFIVRRCLVKQRIVPIVLTKNFTVSTTFRIINPLLPFDVLEEVDNEELEENNKKLKKQKDKLIQKTLKIQEINGKKNEEYKTPNDSIPLKKTISTDVKSLEIKKIDTGAPHNICNDVDSDSAKVNSSSGGGGDGNGGDKIGKDRQDNDEEMNNDDGKKNIERELESEMKEEEENNSKWKDFFEKFSRFVFKCLETIGITFSSIAILGIAGLLYHKFYGHHVLSKMDESFDKGDPAFQLTIHKRTNKHADDYDVSEYWVERPQQALLDDIISGKIVGRYFLVIGEKGTGKTSLLLESMKQVDGFNVAIFDAHADPEIFRIRLGKALNFTYSEDYIGSLFSIRGPRDTTALLDIERAFGKLEELAIKRVAKFNKPLVLIINNSHLIKDNEEGVKLLELLQQKAESLSGSGLVTIIFNSDDYWVYEKLKKLGTRLELINVRDFNRSQTVQALKFIREKHFPSNRHSHLKLSDDDCHKIYDLIGGRPQHISQVARHKNIFRAAHEIIDREKTWFLNQCGLLGMDMDDDVMESGKFATSAMLLMREFVEMDRKRLNTLLSQDLPDPKDERKDHILPELPLWRSRQIMTRADYIQQYDNLNIFTIDSESRVRADSIPMMRAFHEIASQPHFDELLRETIQRVADIESLSRTRELVSKDLNLGSKYHITSDGSKYIVELKPSPKQIELHGEIDYEDDDDDDDVDELFMEDISKKDHQRKWWKKRMQRFDQSYLPPLTKDKYDIDINRTNN